MSYKPTIGLEIHAELNTKTKMFCSCRNDPDEKRPNVNICPVCMAHPGTLPAINQEAIKHVLKVGTALGGVFSKASEFDRKNYFYPDIPKGYQISQYKYPFIRGGELVGVKITRVHLEEDTAKSIHQNNQYSLVDFNRAGLPLMELVTEPVIHNSNKVVEFGEELQMLLQYLGVSEANMEKGQMRLEVNISVSKDENLGTKVEIKNLNSFRSAEKAIECEIKRQIEILDSGGRVDQETRGFDEATQKTFSQRKKESSHDYRYFPDPDLPKMDLSEVENFSESSISANLKETPSKIRERLSNDFGIKKEDIEFYLSNQKLRSVFEETAKCFKDKNNLQTLSNFIVSDIKGFGEAGVSIKTSDLAEVVQMFVSKDLSSRGAKDVLSKMVRGGKNPRLIAEEDGLFQKNNEDELTALAKLVVSQNQSAVSEYKKGKMGVIQFLVGQVMKASNGSANPKLAQVAIENLLR